MSKNNSGFTLIELLVVISIIGMLATIILMATLSTRYSAKTATMKSEFVHLKAAFDLYYQNHGDKWGLVTPPSATTKSCPSDPIFVGTVFNDPIIAEQLTAMNGIFLGGKVECLAAGENGPAVSPTCPTGNCATTWSLMMTAPGPGGSGINKWCMTNHDSSGGGASMNNIYNTFLGPGESKLTIFPPVTGFLYVTECIPLLTPNPNWN